MGSWESFDRKAGRESGIANFSRKNEKFVSMVVGFW